MSQAKPSQQTELTGLSLCPGAWAEPRSWWAEASTRALLGSPRPWFPRATSRGWEDMACSPPGAWGSQNGNQLGRTASVVMGPLLWAALRVRTDHLRGTARELGGGRRSPQAPPRAGDWTGTRVSQLQVRGLKSEGRLWEMQTVGRKGHQELSAGGRGMSSEDWSGASGAVLAGGSPAGAQRQEGWVQGGDWIPGCVLLACGAGRGCVLRMALLKDLVPVETRWSPQCAKCVWFMDLRKAPPGVHRLHHPQTQGGQARADAGEQGAPRSRQDHACSPCTRSRRWRTGWGWACA